MKQYKLIARSKKGYHTVTICRLKAYAKRIKQACERLDKKRTYEIIEIESTNH